jgi:very-short-patch-repair endonuclease
VNIEVAGEEADLTWPRRRRIVEIDGPDFHRFPAEDARKQAKCERAGYSVRRLPSDDVYERPERLLAAATG